MAFVRFVCLFIRFVPCIFIKIKRFERIKAEIYKKLIQKEAKLIFQPSKRKKRVPFMVLLSTQVGHYKRREFHLRFSIDRSYTAIALTAHCGIESNSKAQLK